MSIRGIPHILTSLPRQNPDKNMNINTWNIILVRALTDVPVAKAWITTNFPAGTVVYFEKDPPVAPNAPNLNVIVWEFSGIAGVLRVAKVGDNGPFFVLHAITP